MTDNDLIRLIRESGEEWLLRIERSEEQSVAHVRRRLDDAYDVYRKEFIDLLPGETALGDDAVLVEAKENPHRVRALLQAIGASSTVMIAMIWRVVQGDTIEQMDLRYRYEKEFQLRVTIKNEMSDRSFSFTFDRIEDATFLRHLGIMRAGNEPVFDGYYALDLAGRAAATA